MKEKQGGKFVQGREEESCSQASVVANIGPTDHQVHICESQIVQCDVHTSCRRPAHMKHTLLYPGHLGMKPAFSDLHRQYFRLSFRMGIAF